MKSPVTIVIADDHRLMLDGLATLIESIPGFHLMEKFGSGRHLLDWLSSANKLPDMCIVDIEMPGLDGVETVKFIRNKFPQLKVMVLTMHTEWHFVNKAIAAGAHAYLIKNVDREVFINSIQKVLIGESFITAGLGARPESGSDSGLTARETEILILIANGKTNQEIADEIFVSHRTVDTHRTNIKKKLGLHTLAELIQYARERGMV